MKNPARHDHDDQPPEVTPEYLDMLRRRWQDRIARTDFKALVAESAKELA